MKAGIALGSNIEPRLLHLSEAFSRIRALHEGSGPALGSKVYETAPLDCPVGSPLFLNGAIEIETSTTPSSLLASLQKIEQDLGRPLNQGYHLPRTIDLDLLYLGDLTIQTPELTLPHPAIAQRLFVLVPLADIRPNLIPPGWNTSVATVLSQISSPHKMDVYCNAIY